MFFFVTSNLLIFRDIRNTQSLFYVLFLRTYSKSETWVHPIHQEYGWCIWHPCWSPLSCFQGFPVPLYLHKKALLWWGTCALMIFQVFVVQSLLKKNSLQIQHIAVCKVGILIENIDRDYMVDLPVVEIIVYLVRIFVLWGRFLYYCFSETKCHSIILCITSESKVLAVKELRQWYFSECFTEKYHKSIIEVSLGVSWFLSKDYPA